MIKTFWRLITWPWRERPNYARIAELERSLGMISLDEQLEALAPAPFFATNPPPAKIIDFRSLRARELDEFVGHGPGYEQLERAYRR